MRVMETTIYNGKNIYSNKKVIKVDLDLEEYFTVLSCEIDDFNTNLLNMINESENIRYVLNGDKSLVEKLVEGIYLEDVCKSIIIIIQNKVGLNVSFANSIRFKDGGCCIIFEYVYQQAALESLVLAVDIINTLKAKVAINYDDRIKFIKEIIRKEEIDPISKSICDVAEDIGLPVIKIGDGNFYQVGYGKQGRIIESAITSATSCVAVDMAYDKLLTKELLVLHNIPVAKGKKVHNVIDLLARGEELGYPLLLKPRYGNGNDGAILNIKNQKELLRAYDKVRKHFSDIIVEEYYRGNEYRVWVINYKVVATVLNKTLCTGEEIEEYSDVICEENRELCIRAAKSLGLNICCIDICTKDICKPIYGDGIVKEVNASPRLNKHVNPIVEPYRDMAKEILNMLYCGNITNIPIISIGGTNGNLATAMIIRHTLTRMGYRVGVASSDRMCVEKRYIDLGNNIDIQSVKSVLLNKEVDIAVIETGTKEIIERGLEYDLADVAIIANLDGENLAVDSEKNTIEGLLEAKLLVGKAVKKDGCVVLNAEDKFIESIIPTIKVNKIFFSKTKQNNLILDVIENLGMAVYIEEGYIIVSNYGRTYRVCKFDEIQVLLKNKLDVQNILEACAALVAMRIDYCMIRNGLNSYYSSFIKSKECLG